MTSMIAALTDALNTLEQRVSALENPNQLKMLRELAAYEERRMRSYGPVVGEEHDEVWTYGIVVFVLYILSSSKKSITFWALRR